MKIKLKIQTENPKNNFSTYTEKFKFDSITDGNPMGCYHDVVYSTIELHGLMEICFEDVTITNVASAKALIKMLENSIPAFIMQS